VIYRSKAPLRLSFAGGGTDVPPYPERYGGVVLASTITRYAYVSLRPRADGIVKVQSLDHDVMAKYDVSDEDVFEGERQLADGVLHHFGIPDGADIFLHTDAPPGSGLGSSSAMTVAIIGALRHWLQLPLTSYETADHAVKIERVDLGIKGGLQDQYATTFGGFNLIEFGKDRVVVNPLRVERHLVRELQYRLLLCYTGKTRLTGNILSRQIERYERREKEVVQALQRLKEITVEAKNALLMGRLDDFGDMLNHSWMSKKKLDTEISDPYLDEMYELARKRGAIGGEIVGAGGGGYLLLYCQFDRRHLIAEEVERVGGKVVEFSFEFRGLQTWQVPEL